MSIYESNTYIRKYIVDCLSIDLMNLRICLGDNSTELINYVLIILQKGPYTRNYKY